MSMNMKMMIKYKMNIKKILMMLIGNPEFQIKKIKYYYLYKIFF